MKNDYKMKNTFYSGGKKIKSNDLLKCIIVEQFILLATSEKAFKENGL